MGVRKHEAYYNQSVHNIFTGLQAGCTCHLQEQLFGRFLDLQWDYFDYIMKRHKDMLWVTTRRAQAQKISRYSYVSDVLFSSV